jgi:TonB family protein
MYRSARTRIIPGAAKSLFTEAKQNFENGKVTQASGQFHDVVTLVTEAGSQDSTLIDIKMLAEGFVKLTNQLAATEAASIPVLATVETAVATIAAPATASADAAATRAPATVAAEAAPIPTPAPAARPDSTIIFDASDPNVTAPVAITQIVPRWTAPPETLGGRSYSGVVEIVIDETGSVAAAALTTPVYVQYDRVLLAAAKQWRFQPAQKNGVPVKYRKAVAIVLTPLR